MPAAPPPLKHAAEAYIAEREATRRKGIAIPPHRHYQPGDAGPVAFAGLRQVAGQALALLQQGEAIMVMPLDEATTHRLSRLPLGTALTLKPDGAITRPGRSR